MHSFPNYKDEGGIIVIWKRNSAKLQRGIYRAEGRKEGKSRIGVNYRSGWWIN